MIAVVMHDVVARERHDHQRPALGKRGHALREDPGDQIGVVDHRSVGGWQHIRFVPIVEEGGLALGCYMKRGSPEVVADRLKTLLVLHSALVKVQQWYPPCA